MKIFKIVLFLLSSLILGGCSSSDVKLTTFYVASMKGVHTGRAYKSVVMPFTGTRLIMNTQPIFYTGDISKAQVAEVTMPTGEKIQGFNFILNENGMRKLTNATASNIGSYIVMMYDGKPVGLRIIDEVMTSGSIFVCSEYNNSKKTLHDFVEDINESISKVSKIKEDE